MQLNTYTDLLFVKVLILKSEPCFFLRNMSLTKAEKTHRYHLIKDIFRDNLQIKTVFIHLDNDSAGRKAAEVISSLLKDKYTVKKHFVPVGKDVNDYLCYSKNLPYRTFEKEVACR